MKTSALLLHISALGILFSSSLALAQNRVSDSCGSPTFRDEYQSNNYVDPTGKASLTQVGSRSSSSRNGVELRSSQNPDLSKRGHSDEPGSFVLDSRDSARKLLAILALSVTKIPNKQ